MAASRAPTQTTQPQEKAEAPGPMDPELQPRDAPGAKPPDPARAPESLEEEPPTKRRAMSPLDAAGSGPGGAPLERPIPEATLYGASQPTASSAITMAPV